MVRKIRVSLSSLISDAQERGLVARNVVCDLRSSRNQGHCGAQGRWSADCADGDLHRAARF
jgi:hypothetical protein